jgi:single-stranded-DNA-specific exonuclease
VIALDGDVGKGSGRSIAGVDLGAAISAAVADRLLIAGGGHKMAAGLTLARDAIPSFTAFLELRLRDGVYRAKMERLLEIDAVIAPRAVARPLAALIERAGPFGPGNAEPVFALLDVTADQLREVGSGHFSCRLVGRGGEAARAIAFRATESGVAAALSKAGRIHVAGKIRADDFRGGEAGQFHIIDVAPAA